MTNDSFSDFTFRVSVDELDRSSIQKIKQLTVSTGCLKASRLVQLRPINRVVYPGSLGGKRLSVPDIATQPCPKRDNWYTRGQSFSILSY